jgi:hypothetical protein
MNIYITSQLATPSPPLKRPSITRLHRHSHHHLAITRA